MPLIPALAASSPFLEGRFTGFLDARLETYRHNQKRIPSIAGQVIPEALFTQADYEREVFEKVRNDIAPHDPDHLLNHYFLNSRGAIARFDRGAIEIRLVDIQECPAADIAIAETQIAVLHALVNGLWSDPAKQRVLSTERLAELLMRGVRDGENAIYDWPEFLQAFGYTGVRCTARELWQHIAQGIAPTLSATTREHLQILLRRGTLASTLLKTLGPEPAPSDLVRVYHQLARCLARNEFYHPAL